MKINISDFTVYRPSPENPLELPKLEFCDPLFKRRLSQISRMTIQVVHDLILKNPEAREAKLVFSSFRGELARQLKINKGLYEDADVMPAPFSLSVFNTPPAAATIAEGIKAGYTAVYPSEDNFNDALTAAAAPVLAGSEKQILFVYADEYIIDEYKSAYRPRYKTSDEYPFPLAFACLLTNEGGHEITVPSSFSSPEDFIKGLEASSVRA
jgi:hypothetical protein